MPRLLFKLAVMIALTMTVMGFAARILGVVQPPNSTLRGFTQDCDNQPQPCWYGIVPGVTTVPEVKERLASSGYFVDTISDIQLSASKSIQGDCQNVSIIFDAHVKQINIMPCGSVLLGDFVRQFDQKQYILLSPLSFWYGGVIQIIFGRSVSSWDEVGYYTALKELIIFPDKGRLPQMRQPWLDLLLQRKYCKLNGFKYVCSD